MKFLRYMMYVIFFGSVQLMYAPVEELSSAHHDVDAAQKKLEETKQSVEKKELEAQKAQEARDETLKKEKVLEVQKSQGQDVSSELQKVEFEKAQKELAAEKAQKDLQETQQLKQQEEKELENLQAKLTVAQQNIAQADHIQAEKIKIAQAINNAQIMAESVIVSEGNKLESRSLETSVADYQDLIDKRKALEVMKGQFSVDSLEYKSLEEDLQHLQGVEQVARSTVVEKLVDLVVVNKLNFPEWVLKEKLNVVKRQFDLVGPGLDPSLNHLLLKTSEIIDHQNKYDDSGEEKARSELQNIAHQVLFKAARELDVLYKKGQGDSQLNVLLESAHVTIMDRVITAQRKILTDSSNTQESVDAAIGRADELISNIRNAKAKELIENARRSVENRLAELEVLRKSLDLFPLNTQQEIITKIVYLRLQLAELEVVSEKSKPLFERVMDSFFRKINRIFITLGFNVVGYSNPVDGIRSSAQLFAQIEPSSPVIHHERVIDITVFERGQLQPQEQIDALTQMGKNINRDLITTQSTTISTSYESAKVSVDKFEKAFDTLLSANSKSVTSETYKTLNLLVDQARQSLAPAVDAVVAAQRLHVDMTVMAEQAGHISYNSRIIDTIGKDFAEIVKPGQSLQANDIKNALQIDITTGKALNVPVIDPFELGHSMMSKDNNYRRQLGEQALRSFEPTSVEDIFAASDYLTQRSTGSRVLSLIEIVVQAEKSGQSPQFSSDEEALYQKIKDSDFFKQLPQELTSLGSDTLKAWNEQPFTQWTSEQFAQLGSVRERQYVEEFGRVDKDDNKVPIVQAVRNISVYGANVPVIIDFMTGTKNGFTTVKQDAMDAFKKTCITDPANLAYDLSQTINKSKDSVLDLMDRVDAMQQKLQDLKVAATVSDDPLNQLTN
jgi:hypothetical protein